jgi:transcriptional regulator with XRE-family HTH domain
MLYGDDYKEFKEFVRNKISAIRIANGFSSRSLSLELYKSTEYLNQLENDRLNPSLEFLFDFCGFFKLSLSEFFDADNAHPTEFKELCKDLAYLNSDEVTQIASLVKTIAKTRR